MPIIFAVVLYLLPLMLLTVGLIVGLVQARRESSAVGSALVGLSIQLVLIVIVAIINLHLHHVPVENGPVGATCPDTSGGLIYLSWLVTQASAVVAGLIAYWAGRSRRWFCFPLPIAGVFLAYCAVLVFILPGLCDYS